MKVGSLLLSGFALFIAACGVPSAGEGNVDETSQAICADGIKPGCDECVYDPSSPKGGYQICWSCGGNTRKQACYATKTINSTWTGHVWIWNSDGHPSNNDFTIPVRFQAESGTWKMYVDSLSLSLLGDTFSLQSGQIGSGSVNGGHAWLQLPIHGSPQGHTIDVSLGLSTENTIYPPNAASVGGYPYDGNILNMVGTGTYNGSSTFWAFFQGHFSSWPQ